MIIHPTETCQVPDCTACVLQTRLTRLHGDLAEYTSELHWKSVIANWSQLIYRTLYSIYFPYKIFRPVLKEASGAAVYQHWRVRILVDQRQEVLDEVINAEYEIALWEADRSGQFGYSSSSSSSSQLPPRALRTGRTEPGTGPQGPRTHFPMRAGH